MSRQKKIYFKSPYEYPDDKRIAGKARSERRKNVPGLGNRGARKAVRQKRTKAPF